MNHNILNLFCDVRISQKYGLSQENFIEGQHDITKCINHNWNKYSALVTLKYYS